MAYIARVSKPGYDAQYAALRNLNFYETKPTFKIVKQVQLPAAHSSTVAHGLSYAPQFIAYSDESSELFPAGSDNDTTSLGGRNFMVGVGNTNITFDDVSDAKKVILFSDRPSATGVAETGNLLDDYVFKVMTDESPQRVVVSSEYNHLKEYASGQITVDVNHTNPGVAVGTNIVLTNHSSSVAHTLGFRPFIVATVRQIYHSDNINGGGVIDPDDPSVNMIYNLPYNSIQYYNPIGSTGIPGVSSQLALYYGIKDNQIKFYAKQQTVLLRGFNPIDGINYVSYQTIDQYEITYKIFYNDLDEVYSYL